MPENTGVTQEIFRLSDIADNFDYSEDTENFRLGDIESVSRVDTLELNDFQIVPVSEEQKAIWEKLGPIGYGEQAIRQDKTEMIPFNPESAVKSVSLLYAIKRIQRDNYAKNPDQKEIDTERVQRFFLKHEEERIRGFTIGGKITKGVAALPGFMLEFLATGGLAALGKKGIVKAGQQAVKAATGKALSAAIKRGTIKATTRVAATAIGAIARTVGMPHRVVEGYADRQVNASLEFTTEGAKLLPEAREKPFTSFSKAIGDVVIENFSEELGGAILKGTRRLLPSKMANALTKLFKKLHPNQSVKRLFTKAGYNNFIGELGEERIGALLRAVTGVEDFGADDPDNMFDRIIASIPDGEELLVEAGVLAFPGGLSTAAQVGVKVIQDRKVARGEKVKPSEDISKADISDEKIDEILATEEEVVTTPELDEPEEVVEPIEPEEAKPRIEPLTPTELARLDVLEAELGELEGEEREEQRELEKRFAKAGVIGGEKKITALQKAIKQARDKFVTEPSQTKAEIRATQEQFIKLLEVSKLEAKDKAKFVRAIKNVQTVQQLNKVFPEIAQRILILEEKTEIRKFKSAIKKSVKKTKPRKQTGKPVSKLTPEVQKAFDFMREAVKLTQDQANEKLMSNLSQEGIPSEEVAFQNKILGLASGQQFLTAEELKQLSDEIETLKAGGKAKFQLKAIAEAEQRQQDIEQSRNSILGGKTPNKSRIKSPLQKLRKALSTPFKSILGWDNLLNLLAIENKEVKPGESAIERIASVKEVETAEKKGTRIAMEKVVEAANKAFGFTKESQMIKKFQDDSVITDLGVFKNVRGEEVNFELSRAEARKLWMELQDPSLNETFTSEFGNAYSPAMIQAVEEFLTQEDKEFARNQLAFYRDFYKTVNAVYRDIYGIDLPFNEFYSPISREFKDTKVTDEFLRDINFRRSVASGSLKSRVANIRPIKLQSDTQVIQKHVIEMEHFKTWSKKIRQLNNIFTDNQTKDLIDEKFGPEMQKTINNFIEDFTRGGIDRSKNFGAWDALRIGFTRAALALKPALLMKQLVSFVAYANAIPITAFTKGVADFVAHPIKSTDILNQSEFLKARGQNITRDIRDAMQSSEWAAFRKKPTFLNSLMLTTRLGDRGAILFGGWSVYKHTLDKTGSKEKAMQEFEDVSSDTQQSSDLSQLSRWQRGNTFQKMFTMFTSSQNQYFRKEYLAIRNLIAGKISVNKAAKTILIYHFLLPMFFQWVSDFGKWDKDEQLRAAILGSFNGIFIINDMLDSIIRQSLGLRKFDAIPAPLTIPRGLMRGVQKLTEDDISMEDVIEAIQDISETVGFATGIPFKTLNDWAEGVKDVQKGKPGRGALKLLGWSPYVVEKNLGKPRSFFGR